MKNVQWLTEIELVPHDYKGYYQKKGWSDDATVKTMSWINDPLEGNVLPPRDLVIKGFAFAGTRGIRMVQVSTDGGQSWEPAKLEPALSPYSWVFWSYRWESPRPGGYGILARAIDGFGELQSAIDQDPYPSGTSVIQEVLVTVEG